MLQYSLLSEQFFQMIYLTIHDRKAFKSNSNFIHLYYPTVFPAYFSKTSCDIDFGALGILQIEA